MVSLSLVMVLGFPWSLKTLSRHVDESTPRLMAWANGLTHLVYLCF